MLRFHRGPVDRDSEGMTMLNRPKNSTNRKPI